MYVQGFVIYFLTLVSVIDNPPMWLTVTNCWFIIFKKIFRRTNPFGESGRGTRSETEGKTDVQYFYVLEILSSKLKNLLFIFVLLYAILMVSLFTSQFSLFSQLTLQAT